MKPPLKSAEIRYTIDMNNINSEGLLSSLLNKFDVYILPFSKPGMILVKSLLVTASAASFCAVHLEDCEMQRHAKHPDDHRPNVSITRTHSTPGISPRTFWQGLGDVDGA